MSRLWQRLALIFVAAGKCFAADYVGPEKCRACHPAEFATQSHSRHNSALRPINDTPLPALLAGSPIQERSGVSFEYTPGPNNLLLAVTQGGKRLEASLDWAFGSGAQAYTPVGIRNGSYFEHRVSYYTSAGRPGRTLGHPGEASRSLESALGMVQSSETINRCFNCHATGVRPGPDLSKMRAGISCERCHGPGSEHLNDTRSINGLSKLTADASVRFCAQCHRSPVSTDSKAAPEVKDPLSIRFQPVGLMASRCFQKSGTLSCVTCHNPHEDARREPAFYIAKCIGCHASEPVPNRPTACGLSKHENCLPCHMERRAPAEYLSFTDHRIRIYEKLSRDSVR
ncbi:MAG: multiheme c-type cytochrome [Bryobacteraceae bacterium]